MLQYFGNFIQSLELDIDRIESKMSLMNRLINARCTETLTELKVRSSIDTVFDDYTKPFKSVENLSLDGNFKSLGNAQFSLNELFPAVRRLGLGSISLDDKSSAIHHYPHLEHLRINLVVIETSNFLNENEITELIKLNPQVKSLALHVSSQNLLKLVTEEMRSLETLTLNGFYERVQDEEFEINFENVKVLRMQCNDHSMPKNITFPQLVEFETDALPRTCSRWIDFVGKTKSLKKLLVKDYYMKDAEISRLANADLSLQEIRLSCREDVQNESIIQLLQKSKELRKAHIEIETKKMLVSIVQEVEQKFGHQWNIVKNMFSFDIERKF